VAGFALQTLIQMQNNKISFAKPLFKILNMQVNITKKNNRNQLTCVRPNGTIVQSNLGPKLPFHDIAHLIVENTLNLNEGFYGNILKGYSVEQLSDKQIIKMLPPQLWFAEITTRALQSLSSGACTVQQFPALVQTELQQFSINYNAPLTTDAITKMIAEYRQVMQQWQNLPEGETLKLKYNTYL